MAAINKEVIFERTYNAPAKTIWQAWTDPQQLKQWWGPDNVSIPECEIELRVGGRFYIVMEADQSMGDFAGTRWPMDATYTTVESASKLAYTAKAWTEDDEAATAINQVAELVLSEENGQTKMVLKATIVSAGPKAGMAVEGMQHGYNQQFDKLKKFLQA